MTDGWHWFEKRDEEFTFSEIVFRHIACCLAFTDIMPDGHLQAVAAVALLLSGEI